MTEVPEKHRSIFSRLWIRSLWLARHEGLVLATLLAIALGVWGFIEIADEVVEGDTRTFDEWVIQGLRSPENLAEPVGPYWMKAVAMDVTALGGVAVLTLFILCIGLYLLLEGKIHAMWLVWGTTVTGTLLSVVLKQLFDRPRPDVVPHLTHAQSASFPSGHSLMSAVVYLTLGALVARFVLRRRVKVYVFCVALFLTGIIGMSRVYLGVHYPTDVLAGWTAGLVWALLCWTLASSLQRQGKVEPPGQEPSSEIHSEPETRKIKSEA